MSLYALPVSVSDLTQLQTGIEFFTNPGEAAALAQLINPPIQANTGGHRLVAFSLPYRLGRKRGRTINSAEVYGHPNSRFTPLPSTSPNGTGEQRSGRGRPDEDSAHLRPRCRDPPSRRGVGPIRHVLDDVVYP